MTDDETNLTSLLGSVSSAHYVGDEEVLSGVKGGREGGREGGRREGGLTSEDTKKGKPL